MAAPTIRGQGNGPYNQTRPSQPVRRGQSVPYDMNGAPTGASGDAVDIAFTPTGAVAATNVQAAIAEVDAEKIASSAAGAFGLSWLATATLAAAKPLLALATVATSGDAADLTGTLSNLRLAAFTGDATKPAGSGILTLATVNSNTGTYGGIKTSAQISVNGKGLITGVSAITIQPDYSNIDAIPTARLLGRTTAGTGFAEALTAAQVKTFLALVAADIPNIAESQVTNLTTDLALKAPLASPTFTGTVTAGTVNTTGTFTVDGAGLFWKSSTNDAAGALATASSETRITATNYAIAAFGPLNLRASVINISPGGTLVGAVSSTGLAITGTISASSTISGSNLNAFTAFSGPATSLKTFTLPNASATILTDNAAVTAAQGGTGVASYAVGDLLYASAATTLSKLAAVATGNVLISGGVTTAPSWGKVDLTAHVSGILPAANGGTGNGFTAFTGPATSTKTFALPNASDTIACLGQAQTFTVAQIFNGNVSIGTTTATARAVINSGAAATPAGWIHNSANAASSLGLVVSTADATSSSTVFDVRSNNAAFNGGSSLFNIKGDGTTALVGNLTVTGASNSTGNQLISGTGAQGYATGSGGTVTQLTSKSTGVTLSKTNGQIITHNAALASAAVVSFTVTNTTVAATDTINLILASGNATAGTYRYWIDKVSAGSFVIAIENRSAGSLSEALTFNFAVVKAVTS